MSEPDWMEVARETGLAITHKDGIKEVDAGRDRALCLNEIGLTVLRRALEQAYRQGVDRASDERPTGPRPSGLGGDSPASAVDGAISDGEAPGISVTEQICFDKLKKENAELREALRPFATEAQFWDQKRHSRPQELLFPDGRSLGPGDITIGHLRRARALLSQSSEGE